MKTREGEIGFEVRLEVPRGFWHPWSFSPRCSPDRSAGFPELTRDIVHRLCRTGAIESP